MLCEFLVLSPCNHRSVQYEHCTQNAAFDACSDALYDIVFLQRRQQLPECRRLFCNTALSLINDFSHPLRCKKSYNMTKRAEMVIFQEGAALAFTDYETEQLRNALLKETRHCAVTLGMKKTSVDQLTRGCRYRKGSFYKFFRIREMAFSRFWKVST